MEVSILPPTLGCFDVGFASIPPSVVSRCVSHAKRPSQRRPDLLSKPGGNDAQYTAAAPNAQTESRLLSLPLEIRLLIYDWVYRMSPIEKTTPHEAYPIPAPRSHHTRLVQDEEELQPECRKKLGGRGLLCQERFYNHIPCNLLRLNRQIYVEARSIPFHSNEFVFDNWFSSGLVAASTMVTDVFETWQTRTMRFARIGTNQKDFRDDFGLGLWRKLSTEWRDSLRGLKVLIHVSKDAVSEDTNLLDVLDGLAERWVVDGYLAEMKALERLEVELSTPPWCSDTDKLAWCRALQLLLECRDSHADVVCVKCDPDR